MRKEEDLDGGGEGGVAGSGLVTAGGDGEVAFFTIVFSEVVSGVGAWSATFSFPTTHHNPDGLLATLIASVVFGSMSP
jgi:hypothetical protein